MKIRHQSFTTLARVPEHLEAILHGGVTAIR